MKISENPRSFTEHCRKLTRFAENRQKFAENQRSFPNLDEVFSEPTNNGQIQIPRKKAKPKKLHQFSESMNGKLEIFN